MGYAHKMDKFFSADPGLDRRFPTRLDLKPYSAMELARIAELKAKHKKIKFADGLLVQLARHMSQNMSVKMAKQNGGLSQNLFEAAHRNMISREVRANKEGR